MTAEQLWETTLNPETRRLLQVNLGAVDATGTESRFTMMMGKGESAARKAWIEEHGNEVEVDV
jgi:topoisomerase-4 subunit B